MRRPINWVVVLISICFLLANTTLTGRGIGGLYSASGDSPSSSNELFAMTLSDVGTRYAVEPAVVVTLDDEFSDSPGILASMPLARFDRGQLAAATRFRAAHSSGWNRVAAADPFEFVEALDDERPVVTRVR